MKMEYKKIMLPFINATDSYELSLGVISLEAQGNIDGEIKYCYASYLVNSEFVDELAALLKRNHNKPAKIILMIKNQKVIDFKFDLQSLADIYNDERFKSLKLISWGLNDKSFRFF